MYHIGHSLLYYTWRQVLEYQREKEAFMEATKPAMELPLPPGSWYVSIPTTMMFWRLVIPPQSSPPNLALIWRAICQNDGQD